MNNICFNNSGAARRRKPGRVGPRRFVRRRFFINTPMKILFFRPMVYFRNDIYIITPLNLIIKDHHKYVSLLSAINVPPNMLYYSISVY